MCNDGCIVLVLYEYFGWANSKETGRVSLESFEQNQNLTKPVMSIQYTHIIILRERHLCIISYDKYCVEFISFF